MIPLRIKCVVTQGTKFAITSQGNHFAIFFYLKDSAVCYPDLNSSVSQTVFQPFPGVGRALMGTEKQIIGRALATALGLALTTATGNFWRANASSRRDDKT